MNLANPVARRHVTVTLLAVVTCLLGAGVPSAVSSAGTLPKELAPLAFLLGDWEGGGSGTPGQGSGGTSFAAGLQDRVIVRTNVADIAATDKAPASRHDDLMIIYADDRGVIRADYYDNEGHVIRYGVTTAGEGQVAFTSEASANGPRYRITYQTASGGIVKGSFAVAPPGKPDAFTPYLTWDMSRTKAPR